MRSLFLLAVPAVLSLSIACGDDGTPSSSGVDKTKSAGALTDGEAKKLCEFLDAVTPTPSKDQACTYLALFGQSPAQDKASCEAIVSACKAQASGSNNGIDCSNSNASKLAGCNATVAEIETCFKDAGRETGAFFQDISCNEAGHPAAIEPAASCVKVKNECPMSFDM